MTKIEGSFITIGMLHPSASGDILFEKTQELISEINADFGPIAFRSTQRSSLGAKGDGALVGEIVLALISAGITTQIAQIIIGYIKRNPRFTVQIGDLTISKDHANIEEVRTISRLAKELRAKPEI